MSGKNKHRRQRARGSRGAEPFLKERARVGAAEAEVMYKRFLKAVPIDRREPWKLRPRLRRLSLRIIHETRDGEGEERKKQVERGEEERRGGDRLREEEELREDGEKKGGRQVE